RRLDRGAGRPLVAGRVARAGTRRRRSAPFEAGRGRSARRGRGRASGSGPRISGIAQERAVARLLVEALGIDLLEELGQVRGRGAHPALDHPILEGKAELLRAAVAVAGIL